MSWTSETEAFLVKNYPIHGKKWCMNELGKSEASIRAKAARLNLRQNKDSEFFTDWQTRAAGSKVGKKRPEQAEVIRALHAEGKMVVSEEGRKAISKATKKRQDEKGHPRGALGMKHSEEAKQKMSERSINTWKNKTQEQITSAVYKAGKTREANGTLPPQRPNASWKAGWRHIGAVKKYYRSRWEANYARYLEWLKVRGEILDWEHEPKTFWFDGIKRGCLSYLPDFRVTTIAKEEEFHEVKGWMDDRSKTKIKRMAKYHPKTKLIVIATKQYKEIERKLSKIIPEWEA